MLGRSYPARKEENPQNNKRGYQRNAKKPSSNFKKASDDVVCNLWKCRHDVSCCPLVKKEKRNNEQQFDMNGNHRRNNSSCSNQPTKMLSEVGKSKWVPFVYGNDDSYEVYTPKNDEKKVADSAQSFKYVGRSTDVSKVPIIKEKKTVYDEYGKEVAQTVTWTRVAIPVESIEINFEADHRPIYKEN